MTNQLLYIARTCTPTHVGCGQGLDDIDLPLQRGVVSGLPVWPGSTVKGVLRDHAAQEWGWTEGEVNERFGPDRQNAAAHAGMLMPQDAQLLALPVASLCGGWAWVTSRETLRRLRREAPANLAARATAWPSLPPAAVHTASGTPTVDTACVPEQSPLRLPAQTPPWVTLAELALNVDEQPGAATACQAWGEKLAQLAYPGTQADDAEWRQQVAQRLVIVGEEAFAHLCRMATEVRSRVSLGPDGVAQDSALWREECLPPDTLMWGLVAAQPATHPYTRPLADPPVDVTQWRHQQAQQALDALQACTLQIGGKASVGYGWVQFFPVRSV
jgi:CRISPR-associated protein Cmr4